jgi:hypothetical protein
MVLTTEREAAPQDTSCMHHWFKPPKQTEVLSRGRYNHPAIPNAMLRVLVACAGLQRGARITMNDNDE